jgi:hypothetical protein
MPSPCLSGGVRKSKSRRLLHDEATPNIMQTVKTSLTYYKWEALSDRACSPGMCPEFDPFPKLKEPLRGEEIPVFRNMECSNDRLNSLTPVDN